MQTVDYISEDELIQLHHESIARFGGLAGVRDAGAIQSCLALPKTFVFGVERFQSLAEKAAAYCFFIVRNHPFHDGNKRTGLAAAVHFLLKNGVSPVFDDDSMFVLVTDVASGKRTIENVMDFFGGICVPPMTEDERR